MIENVVMLYLGDGLTLKTKRKWRISVFAFKLFISK